MKKYGMTALFSAFLLATPAMAQENLFRYSVGDYEVYTLTDRSSDGNSSILIGATPEMLAETMPDGTYATAVHAFLVKGPEGNILFDTGLGIHIHEQLAALGIKNDEPIVIKLTHMHGDHIGGLMKDGQRVFPQGKLLLSETEYNYWTSKEEMNKLPGDKQGAFRMAQNVLETYAADLGFESLSRPGTLDIDGIYALEAFGHTPGHTAYLLVSKGEKLLIWGDLAHAMAIQMPYPDVAVTYDVDPAMATASRKEILRYVTRENIPVAGMHIPGTGIGRVETIGENSYRFIAIGE
ncbi:MAG: MBL fold metallo-hydrolase [Bacteroides sp.]|nr:MBL fold metallo-hydrolase [Bacteroides sp.]